MSRKEKLLLRLLSRPKDFTYAELKTLLGYYGYQEFQGGNTSGSAVKFYHETTKRFFTLHRPHPGNIIKTYLIIKVIEFLKEDGIIE